MRRKPKPRCRRASGTTEWAEAAVPWYSDWQIQRFTCKHFGWTGKRKEAFPDEVGMMECPSCEHGVGYVTFPSLRDTERAAAEGIQKPFATCPEKRAWVERMEARMKRFRLHELCSVEQLPDIAGESLEFTWDLEEHVGEENEDYQVIRVGESEIWRELAFFDNIGSMQSRTC